MELSFSFQLLDDYQSDSMNFDLSFKHLYILPVKYYCIKIQFLTLFKAILQNNNFDLIVTRSDNTKFPITLNII